ncbi:MAG: polysaccharide biosynthesis tyrosine autokinase, partial [Oscillochloris sp.]|nr:polysaccharide biosynthesis tyrosine autokinase [Oscillochloris sp.]
SPRSADLDYGLLEYAVRLKNTYAEIAESGPAIQALQQRFGIDRSAAELRDGISVEFPSNNELMSVVARDHDSGVAATIANAVSALLIEEAQRSRNAREFMIEQIQPAIPPAQPDLAPLVIVIALGVIASLGAGLTFALIVDSTDNRLHTPDHIAKLVQLPILANIPRIGRRARKGCCNGSTPAGESFRQLRTNLTLLRNGDTPKTIIVTSAEPGEGKTLVAANLAYSLSQLGRRVLVIDADLRLPTLHTIFNVENRVGLGNVLHEQATLEDAVAVSSSHNLHVIPSGSSAANPADLLSSTQFHALLQRLAERYDAVVIDSPAYLAVADANILTRLADAVLFVVRCAWSNRHSVQSAYGQMALADAPLLGVVANGTGRNRSYAYYRKRYSKMPDA